MRRHSWIAGTLLFGVLAASSARADILGFSCITDNNAGECGFAAPQLSVEVTDAGGGLVLFTFKNAGPSASSIADVYFDNGFLQSLESVINSPGVSFSAGATPANLPAGNSISPAFDATFSADSDAPVAPNGVNPGEMLGIRFSLEPGKTFAEVLADIAAGGLRIGIHVQALPSGGSDSLVTLPEPGGLALLGVGVLALTALVRPSPTRTQVNSPERASL